jgi:hypothetical protein
MAKAKAGAVKGGGSKKYFGPLPGKRGANLRGGPVQIKEWKGPINAKNRAKRGFGGKAKGGGGGGGG